MSFGWNYPPGVTGNEPEITGEWPCVACGGEARGCRHCRGTGIEPEEFDIEYLEMLADEGSDCFVAESIVAWAGGCLFNREEPVDRRYLRAICAIHREQGRRAAK